MFKTIGTKVLAGILVCAFTGALTIYMVTTLGYEDLSDRNAKRMLSMMSESIFQTLRLSMFSGDRIVIEDTIKRASHIVGVHQLTIVPNQDVINTFDMNIKYTTDPNVLEVFNSKRSKWIETNNGKDHHVRMLKPLIAEPICLRCHFLSKTQDVLGVMDLDISLNTNDMMIRASQAKLGLFMIVALTIAVLFGVLFFRSFNRKLHTIQVGLLSFFSFLNHTKNRATRLSIDSNDELGQMAKVINKNISRIESGLIKDRHFISEATQIVVRLNSGFLSERLRADTDNHGLRALKEVINQMLTALHSNIKEILSVLNAYREDDYTALINSGALDGELRDLNNGINRLGESIGIMLSGNLENGQQL
ncbi:MAG: hypothetical protein LBN32_04930, partial [Helicobacteraceae bacterium]|nr:hypothetical protein [Helicobacteraceae bacterium]